MQTGAQIMTQGDISLGRTYHFIGAFGRAGGTAKMLQDAADNPLIMEKIVALFGTTELLVSATIKVWKTWKTIKLGTGLQTADDFRKAVKKAGMKISDWGNDLLSKPAFTTSAEEMEVELVTASVAELGFKDGATRKDIYVRAQELGLDLCPSEVGPQLRLQYTDQPKGERLVIAMGPITGSDGYLRLFFVKHVGDVLWLLANFGHPDHVWGGDDRFVFLRRK